KFVSLNLLVFPGITDTTQELKVLTKLIKDTAIDMIQWRNLNIDPTYYLDHLPHKKQNPLGIKQFIKIISRRFPKLKMGYFNLPKEEFTRFKNLIE
ncbi:MAG: radical SAM protein, partial [Candidatus Omnitrophota bacterium]